MENLTGPIAISPLLFGEEMEQQLTPARYHQVPFLQMLAMQGDEGGYGSPFHQESNLQLLYRLQQQQQRSGEQHESCITHASESLSDHHDAAAAAAGREKKRRKRPRAPALKRTEETENQRLTHIAVERNRRRLMNDHLAALRELMPPSFVQRGDQASVIGGAINFVKELEQRLLYLAAEKRMRAPAPAAPESPLHGEVFIAPQYRGFSRSGEEGGVDVEATVVEGHVNLKVAGRRSGGRLVQAVAAMEQLGLSVLHLNVNSLDRSSVLYSLNLKMEDGCKLASADEVAAVAHQIFG